MPGTLADILYDQADTKLVNQYKWYISDMGYAVWRGFEDGKQHTVRMHRLIMNALTGQIIDHRNGNRLDNRRQNLRFVTAKENANNNHSAKGYTWDKSKNKWMVRYKKQFYGRYNTELAAIKAYKLACSGKLYQVKSLTYPYRPVGVFKNKSNVSYQVRIIVDGKRLYKGKFKTIKEAELALIEMRG